MIAGAILEDLQRLWITLARTSESGEDVFRAVSMTLVVLSPEADDPAVVAGELADVMREHPNRSIVVRLEGARRRIEHRVVADCWRPSQGHALVCSERVEIDAPADSVDALAPVLLALAAPDLPVLIWARSPLAADAAEVLTPVLQPAKVVVNSAEFGDPAAALERLVRHRGPIADLAWTAVTKWREMVRQAAVEPVMRERRVDEVRVYHAAERPGTRQIYVGAWLAQSLATRVSFARGDACGVELLGAGEVACAAEGLGAETADEAALLRAELAVEGRDTVFERTLPKAAELARVLAR